MTETFSAALECFVLTNLLLVVSAGTYFGFKLFLKALKRKTRFRSDLRIIYTLIFISLTAPVAAHYLPLPEVFSPIIKTADTEFAKEIRLNLPVTAYRSSVKTNHDLRVNLPNSWLRLSLLLWSAVGLSYVIWNYLFLFYLGQSCQILRRIGRVKILVSNKLASPASLHTLFSAWVIVPAQLLTRPQTLKVSISHELQHHRQRDTLSIHALETLRSLFILNPAIHFLLRRINDLQEMNCDQSLLGRQILSRKQYCRSLIEAATLTEGGSFRLVGTASFTDSRSQLIRRITMISHPPKNLKAWSTIGTSIAIASAILWTGVPLAGLTGQSKINIKELSWLVAKSQNRSEVKLVANKEVLRWLNHYVESANSRKAFRQAINRMKKHEAMIVSQLEDYKLPNDLLAVTLIESGFRNVDNGYSAGVWQFTAKTARRYGLKVNNQVDERFDIGKETTAGAEYLSRLKAGFGDWHFAFLAYNSGENRVLKAIMKTGTRDSFGVVRSRILPTETQNYLPKILAGILILKNPELVDL